MARKRQMPGQVNEMISSNVLSSAASFRRCTFEKLAFVLLCQADLSLTLLAVSSGFSELNPLVRNLLLTPFYLILVKVLAPVLIAWLTPGKLLIPAIVLLGFVVGWDIKELVVHFI